MKEYLLDVAWGAAVSYLLLFFAALLMSSNQRADYRMIGLVLVMNAPNARFWRSNRSRLVHRVTRSQSGQVSIGLLTLGAITGPDSEAGFSGWFELVCLSIVLACMIVGLQL